MLFYRWLDFIKLRIRSKKYFVLLQSWDGVVLLRNFSFILSMTTFSAHVRVNVWASCDVFPIAFKWTSWYKSARDVFFSCIIEMLYCLCNGIDWLSWYMMQTRRARFKAEDRYVSFGKSGTVRQLEKILLPLHSCLEYCCRSRCLRKCFWMEVAQVNRQRDLFRH